MFVTLVGGWLEEKKDFFPFYDFYFVNHSLAYCITLLEKAIF